MMAVLAVLMPAQKGKSTCPGRKYPRIFCFRGENTMGKYRKLAEDIMNNVGGNWYYNRDPFIQTKKIQI